MSNQISLDSNNNSHQLLPPKIDVVFHSLFRKNNEKLTSYFVSGLIQKKVKVINMDKDRNLSKKYPNEKLGILDLRTELEGGILCNIEVQLTNHANLVDRILYYWSRAFNDQLKQGDDYEKLHKTIAILITDFEMREMKEIEDLTARWLIMLDSNKRKKLTEKLEIRIIEIPKAKKILKKEPKNETAQWLVFLDNPNSTEVSNIMKENKEIKEAVDELDEISQDEELRRVAFLKEKYEHDEAQRQHFINKFEQDKNAFKKDKATFEQDKAEYKRDKTKFEQDKNAFKKDKQRFIHTLIQNGMSKEQISELTQIPVEEIHSLLTDK